MGWGLPSRTRSSSWLPSSLSPSQQRPQARGPCSTPPYPKLLCIPLSPWTYLPLVNHFLAYRAVARLQALQARHEVPGF